MKGCEDRIKNLQDRIREQAISGAVLFYSRDVLYYTGTAQPSYLVVLPEDYFLFVRSGFEFAKKEACIPKEKIIKERRLENIFKAVSSTPVGTQKIGTELDILPVTQFFQYEKIFHGYEFVNLTPAILEQRKRKDPSEIEKIRKACQVIDSGHEAVLSTLKEGVAELELAAAVENAHRLAGHEEENRGRT